ncbi:MAG TPA: hypothetical protein VGX03_14520 [Candidatus Binatia bacterium]|jgi:hypothetical protein|nr:hypothetical protein [Candidatus Binatia bacterium]
MSDFKDVLVEWRYREDAVLSLAGLIGDAAVLVREEQERLIVDAFDRGLLSLAERDDAILADVVVRGQRCDNGSAVLLVIEVAPEIGAADVGQALRRAALWAKLGIPAQPAVAGLTISAEGARLAHDRHVLVSLLPDLLGPDALGHSASARTVQTKRE